MPTRYRAVFNPKIANIGNTFKHEPTTNLNEAIEQLNLIANYNLHLHQLHLMMDYSNIGFIEKSELAGEWETMNKEEL